MNILLRRETERVIVVVVDVMIVVGMFVVVIGMIVVIIFGTD